MAVYGPPYSVVCNGIPQQVSRLNMSCGNGGLARSLEPVCAKQGELHKAVVADVRGNLALKNGVGRLGSNEEFGRAYGKVACDKVGQNAMLVDAVLEYEDDQ